MLLEAYQSFKKLGQVNTQAQCMTKEMAKRIQTCVGGARYEVNGRFYARKFEAESAHVFVSMQKNEQEKRRVEWTIYNNLSARFDQWKSFLIEKQFKVENFCPVMKKEKCCFISGKNVALSILMKQICSSYVSQQARQCCLSHLLHMHLHYTTCVQFTVFTVLTSFVTILFFLNDDATQDCILPNTILNHQTSMIVMMATKDLLRTWQYCPVLLEK